MMEQYYEHSSLKMMIVMNKMFNAIMDKMHRHVKKLGINQTEFLVMFALSAQGRLTIQDIGERIYLTSGSMTYTVDKLEQRGYVERIRCEEDRRKIYIDLTEDGRVFWNKAIGEHVEYLDEMVSDVSEKDLLEYIRLSKLIGKTIEDKM